MPADRHFLLPDTEIAVPAIQKNQIEEWGPPLSNLFKEEKRRYDEPCKIPHQ